MNDRVIPPLEVVSRTLYNKAREEVGLKWHYAYLALLLVVMGSLIFVSYFTQFRTHVMRALVYQELPSNWWDVAIYVIVFVGVIIAYFKVIKWIDKKVAWATNARHTELCLEYIDQLAEQESYRD